MISSNPTKLEISAREGVGDLGEQGIKNEINDWILKRVTDEGKDNWIDEIEIFLPDGGSIRGVKVDAGTFRWLD